MKRSLTAALALIATVCGSTFAHADLDSLLGDWTEAASHDAGLGRGLDDGSDLLLAPAMDATAEIDPEFAVNPAAALAGNSDGRTAEPKTLASANAQGIALTHGTPTDGVAPVPAGYSGPHPRVMQHGQQPVLAINGHQVSGPQANPYYKPGSRQCGNTACQGGDCATRGGCSGGCGELVPREQLAHLEGESECRPHRRPLLPPPTTMLQLFRSKNTYSTVWAGYADETRDRMRNRSPHLNGTWNACDDGGLIEPGCTRCGPGH